jgi:hypothetical protein
MNSKHLAAVAAVMLLTVSACGKDEAKPAIGGSSNTLLSYVPPATPFLAANLQPTPGEVIDSFLLKASPVLITAQAELVRIRAKLESQPDAADTGSKLLLALLQELDGKLNRPGLESLGFDLQSHKVVYGLGAFPVARVSLLNAAALKSTVQRILDKAGIEAPEQTYQGQAYWRLTESSPSGHHRAEISGGLYIAILQDHFAIAVLPVSAEQELLPQFLGLQKPDTSDAAARLAKINAQYGFTPYFTGLLDLSLLADEFLQPGSLLAGVMREAGATALETLSQECRDEFRGIIDHTPRLVAGATELTPDSVGVQYIVETQPAMAEQLAGLVSDVPMVEAVSSRMMEIAFGLKFGPVRDFLQEKMTAITQSPYQCEHLLPLNASATEALAKLSQPMPPLVNNFRGLRASLNRFSMNHSMPELVEGLLAVHVEQPEMFVGMAQMFLPDLAALNLVKGEPPVQIPSSLIPMPDIMAFAALSDNAIGISVGAGEENGLIPYLAQKSGNDGAFLSVNYDSAAYLDFTRKMSKNLQNRSLGMEDDSASDSSDAQQAVDVEIAEAIQQAYKDFAGRTHMRMRFNENGLVIDSRMTFK